MISFRFLLLIFALIIGGFNQTDAQSSKLELIDFKSENISRRKEKKVAVDSFENFVLESDQFCKSRIEHRFIKRGDTVRIRHIFRNDVVKMISSRSLCKEIPYECMKKEEWIITLKPDTTQWIDFKIEKFSGRPIPGGFLIIVIDPEKYDDVKREYDKVKDDYAKSQAFIDSLAGRNTCSMYIREEYKRLGYNVP